MKVVLAPDSFKESMSAAEAARAMARGVREVYPDADCVEVPMADGGEGTTEALVDALGGRWRTVASVDALRRPITAAYGLLPGGVAVIEVAAAVGIGLIAPAERDVLRATSLGVADLVRDALDAGATRLIVGLGGSVTTDGGAGMLAGLGARWLDEDGGPLAPDPTSLATLARVDLTGLDPRLRGITVDLACDVTNPLLGPHGSAAVFGPQKGATPAGAGAGRNPGPDRRRPGGGRDPEVRDQPGAGAAGGLGAAWLSLGARRRKGRGGGRGRRPRPAPAGCLAGAHRRGLGGRPDPRGQNARRSRGGGRGPRRPGDRVRRTPRPRRRRPGPPRLRRGTADHGRAGRSRRRALRGAGQPAARRRHGDAAL
ncbi:MAG: glycerate kinase [Micropruina sp.]